jgi:hypothetical protein
VKPCRDAAARPHVGPIGASFDRLDHRASALALLWHGRRDADDRPERTTCSHGLGVPIRDRPCVHAGTRKERAGFLSPRTTRTRHRRSFYGNTSSPNPCRVCGRACTSRRGGYQPLCCRWRTSTRLRNSQCRADHDDWHVSFGAYSLAAAPQSRSGRKVAGFRHGPCPLGERPPRRKASSPPVGRADQHAGKQPTSYCQRR